MDSSDVTCFALDDQETKKLLDMILSMFPRHDPPANFMTYHAKNPSQVSSFWHMIRNRDTGKLAMIKIQQASSK